MCHVTCDLCAPIAGKTVTEEEVEDMLESDNVAIFTQDVRSSVLAHQLKYCSPADYTSPVVLKR